MSLFTGLDATNTNRLTQFVQLEVPASASAEQLENSELRVFWFRIEGSAARREDSGAPDPAWPLRWVTAEEFMEFVPDESDPTEAAPKQPGRSILILDNTREQLHRGLLLLARAHALVRPLLAAAAGDEELSVAALRELDGMIRQYVRPSLRIVDPRRPEMPLPLDEYPKQCVPRAYLRCVDNSIEGPQFLPDLLLDVRRALMVLPIEGEIPAGGVARCDECSAPFITSRRHQAFCSHRCADTNGARVRRAVKAGKETPLRRRRMKSDCENQRKESILSAV